MFTGSDVYCFCDLAQHTVIPVDVQNIHPCRWSLATVVRHCVFVEPRPVAPAPHLCQVLLAPGVRAARCLPDVLGGLAGCLARHTREYVNDASFATVAFSASFTLEAFVSPALLTEERVRTL